MTKLGSTFVSEDPDSRGTPGPASTVPGPAGPDINTTKGDVAGFDTASARIPVGTNGQVLEADSAEALGVKWATPTGSTPTTTEGDIIQRGASADERLAIGTANQILAVNSGATALEYVTPAGGGTKVIATTTLGSTATSIEITGLTLQSCDIELLVPSVGTTPINVDMFVNSDETQGSYVHNRHRASGAVHSSGVVTNDAKVGQVNSESGTVFFGKMRQIGDNITTLIDGIGFDTATQPINEQFSQLHKPTTTQITAVKFEIDSSTFPVGTKLILRDPDV